MNGTPPRFRRNVGAAALLLVPVLGGAGYLLLARPAPEPPPAAMPPASAEATAEQVRRFCGACHAYPPPEVFPRSAWRKEVKQGYDFLHKDPGLDLDFPPLESVALYYEKRAPRELPPLRAEAPPGPPPASFERRGFHPPDGPSAGVSHVGLVQLLDARRPDVLVCDALLDRVSVLRPYRDPPDWQVLARGFCCARAEAVDLDGDGVQDVLLACLGIFYATNDRVGSVVWLRGAPDGRFAPVTLLDGVGRVADARAADFNGDGKLDLVVAVFGWRETGEVLYLENRTSDWSKPEFVPRELDARHGASHVPVGDLNRDGKPDFVALISQEHETVVAFLGDGKGGFRKETVYAAPHPVFGCGGVELLDFDRDGDLDVLLANGDALDAPYLLKPYHGVQWLENRGTFPFVYHRLADVYGAGSPVAADLDGDGDLDVLTVCFLPAEYFPDRERQKPDAVVLLEQTSPGRFARHVLEGVTCDHLSCAAGDVDGDGLPDLVVGNFVKAGRKADAVEVWKNLSPKRR